MTQDEFIKKYGRNREAKLKDFGIDIHNYLLEMIGVVGKSVGKSGSAYPPYNTMFVSEVISSNKNWFHWGEFYFHSKCDLSYIKELDEIHDGVGSGNWYVLSHSFKNTHNFIVVCPFCAKHFFEKAI